MLMNVNISTTCGLSFVRRSDSISLALLKHLSDSQAFTGSLFKRFVDICSRLNQKQLLLNL